ncbi:M48 family metalloprotease [Duganella sp. FT50W]|uniref:M48 family metalloprotease n=1 Tax=Duganella lactea TaxID=2692173 RepID=A0A6L8MS89_9BURK|nr:M48 family metalloprotease [Duganella lactea]MYM84886.1 M48 family metalloprotease [Duganella lactea]
MLAFFCIIAGGLFLLAVADWLAPDPSQANLAQAIAVGLFLFLFYACAPSYARFIGANVIVDQEMLTRLNSARCDRIRANLLLYDDDVKNANAVGLVPGYATIYITRSFLQHLSDVGLRGILAHESTHVREFHLLVIAIYASVFASLAQLTGDVYFFVSGVLGFLALRRQLEFRADAGGARMAGKTAMIEALVELAVICPSYRFERWVVFLTPYPTLSMRLQALRTGKKPFV